MFIPKVNSKQKRVKRTQNTKQKNWTEATRLASNLLAMAGETWSLLPHCSPWRANMALCYHVARLASKLTRRGEY